MSPGSFAHTGLSASTPADGAILHQGPDNIHLNFTEAVRLVRVTLHNDSGSEIDLEFNPVAAAQSDFSVEFPALQADSYILQWTILGADSHRVEGEISFTVDPDA